MSCCRGKDSSDLTAQILPRLQQSHALSTCWPLLAAPGAQNHPQWLQLCVILMHTAARQHGAGLLLAAPSCSLGPASGSLGVPADAVRAHVPALSASPQLSTAAAAAVDLLHCVKQHVRMAARVPQLTCWPCEPRWSVQQAAAELQASGFVLGDKGTEAAPPQPETPASMPAETKAAVVAAYQQHCHELLSKVCGPPPIRTLMHFRGGSDQDESSCVFQARLQLHTHV